MAANYGELRGHFLALLNRTDCTTALADAFFERAYARINREINGPVLDIETVYEHVGGPTPEVPIETKRVYELWVNGIPYANAPDRLTLTPEIPVLNPAAIEQPSYRRIGRKIHVSPDLQEGDVVRLLHQPRLSRPADNGSDVLIANEEDVLLYAALVEAGVYFEHDMLKMWEDRYAVARDLLNDERAEQLTIGGPQAIQPIVPGGYF